MSPPGRPKGEFRSAQHEATPVTTNLDVPLFRAAHGRTGDKGNRSNISVIAWHPALWDTLVEQVTEEAVARQFAYRRPSRVTRHLLPRISQAFRQGYAVEFGEVGLSKAGIRYQDQHIGWEEVTASCNYDRAMRANCFEVFRLPKAQDNNDLWCRVCLADIPNSALFRDLLSNMFQLRGGRHAS